MSRRCVEQMASVGASTREIAAAVGISPPTLRVRYCDQLARGRSRPELSVEEALFRAATGNGPEACRAAIYWLKTRGGWKV
jgi:transposase-like protein